jgi:hypothetical protein
MEARHDTAAARLNVAFAKVDWTAEERRAAEELARGITDWDDLIDTAARNFILPSMARHLSTMDSASVPPGARDRLTEMTGSFAVRNMLLIGAQRRFKEACLDPLGVDAVFFKGPSLVAQYYPDLGLRPCRDIDILVRPATLPRIVRHAIGQGYRLVVPGRADAPLESRAEIEAALHYRDDASLLSPEGMAIDLQVKLDKYSGIFDGVDVFAEAVPMTLGGKEYATMPPALLFNYLCHHHARHVWARLHWIGDLDAMMSSDRFDPEAALALAARLRQRGTVEAAFELRRLMSPLSSWAETAETWRGLKFLELCLRNLPGDLDLEKRIGFKMIGGEFMYPWQVDADLIRRARWRRGRHILKPTIRQYTRYPLPIGLRWLYVIPRVVDLLIRARDRSRGDAE